MNKVLVVSPHLDDAVFSAGEFLAGRQGVVVVTMLAGTPDPPVRTQWDTKRCGFSTSQDAVQRRRAEDEAAMAVLKATPIHLDFLDGQYKPSDIGELANALSELVEHHQPEFVAGPLGVHHDDHVRVREAVLTANLPVPVWLSRTCRTFSAIRSMRRSRTTQSKASVAPWNRYQSAWRSSAHRRSKRWLATRRRSGIATSKNCLSANSSGRVNRSP